MSHGHLRGVGLQLARAERRKAGGQCAAVLALLVAALVGCSQGSERLQEEAGTRPDVVLITLDTLRPDHLSFYGYRHTTARFLARLARKSTVFRRAFSTSSWTAPATASIFTGRYPTEHGVTLGFFAHRFRVEEVEKTGTTRIPLNRIPADVPTLPEIFRAAGYRTFGLASNVNIGSEIGFDRGFDHFRRLHTTKSWGGASGKVVYAQLKRWEPLIREAGPNFVYLHFNDPHIPYLQREPWYGQNVALKRPASQAAYDSEISYVDDILERAFEKFGWEENTLLIVVSDHGEEFGDHGGIGHPVSLHKELMAVLWMVYAPSLGVKPQVIESNVSLIDLLPTIASLVDLPLAETGLPGRSLTPLLRRERGAEALREELATRFLFAHRSLERSNPNQVWAVVQGNWKLLKKPTSLELYDMDRDPGEHRNQRGAQPELEKELEERLVGFEEQATWGEGEISELEIDQETLEALRNLGYVE